MPKRISFHATVRHNPVEGGVWLLETKDGSLYRPLELPAAFRQDGLEVKVRGRVVERASIAMIGTDFELDGIERSS
jgi:hypothetical protein